MMCAAARRFVVAGGTGFVGRHLVKRLRDRGHQTTVVSRSGGGSIDNVAWSDVERNGLPPDVYGVYNLSGRSILEVNVGARLSSRANAAYVQDVFDSRIGTNRLLMRAAAAADKQPAVYVAASAIGYYPPAALSVEYTESYSGQPDQSLAGRLCSQVERCAFDEVPELKSRRVAARIGVVLGEEGGVLANVLPAFRLGLGGRIGSGRQPLAWIHAGDCARLLEFATLNDAISGVLNVTAPAADDYAKFSRQLGLVLRRPSLLPTPKFVMDAVFGPDRSRIVTEGVNAQPRKALDAGFQFEFPQLERALRDLLA